MHKAVFIDRDNTLIANDGDLGDPEQVVLLDGVRSGLEILHDADRKIVVITNQGGVARGRYEESDVERVHDRIRDLVGTAIPMSFYYCPFHPEGTVERYTREHPWRKPAPGMLHAAATDHGIDLAASWMVGDQLRDAQAGRAAGCRTILLGTPGNEPDVDHWAPNLDRAVRMILEDGG